jgi:signal transduction histidine kinase
MRDELAALYDAEQDQAVIAELDSEADARINRIFWEGGFFLIVLLGGLTIMTRTIRLDAELRRRQQNFLAAVSHEFKSPLASIRLAAETLTRRSDAEDIKRLGNRILADDERLLRMVENLLDTTRLEEGQHKPTHEHVDLHALVGEIIDSARERSTEHEIEIANNVEEDLSVTADATGLETVLRNLLDNSIKACAAGNGKSIAIQAVRTDGNVQMTVSDDGAGFPAEDAEMIFQKFYRSGDEMRRATPGTGLGLYIVRRLCEISGARISAHSGGPGKGATFEIIWPEQAA